MKYKEGALGRTFDVLNIFLMLALLFVCVFPFYYMLVISISNGSLVLQGKVGLIPKGITLAAYKHLLSDPFVTGAYVNTIVYVGVGTAINLFLTSLCAYPLSRRELVGKRFFTVMIVITMIFSGGMIPTYLLVSKTLSLKDTMWAVLLVNGMSTFNMIIMRTFFQTTVPDSLTEAAKIDGANDIRIFVQVVLPVCKPILATMLLFYAISQWNRYFDYMLYLNNKASYPLQLLLRAMVIEGSMGDAVQKTNAASDIFTSEMSIKYGAILITVLPIMVLYPFVQKYLVKGIMIGSIKG
jgi:putative aldouronate transport system permease protein